MKSHGTEGFSLLELLVMLALMAALSAMMATFILQLHPLRRIQEKHEVQEIAERLASVIAADLRSSLPLQLFRAEGRLPMIGQSDSIRFVGVVKTGFATEGLREVSYFLRIRADGQLELVRSIRMRRFSEEEASTQTDVLFSPVRSLSFRYLSRGSNGTIAWSDHWEKSDGMPRAIKLRITVEFSYADVSAYETIAP